VNIHSERHQRLCPDCLWFPESRSNLLAAFPIERSSPRHHDADPVTPAGVMTHLTRRSCQRWPASGRVQPAAHLRQSLAHRFLDIFLMSIVTETEPVTEVTYDFSSAYHRLLHCLIVHQIAESAVTKSRQFAVILTAPLWATKPSSFRQKPGAESQ